MKLGLPVGARSLLRGVRFLSCRALPCRKIGVEPAARGIKEGTELSLLDVFGGLREPDHRDDLELGSRLAAMVEFALGKEHVLETKTFEPIGGALQRDLGKAPHI
jgi:hypothetical protein